MKLIDDIKYFFFQREIKAVIGKLKDYPRELINLKDVKNVGIIFNATDAGNIITVTNFVDFLKTQQKKVKILGFQDMKIKNQDDHRLFNQTDINWYGIPNTSKMLDFQDSELDVLICAYIDQCLPLEYIVATSKAKYRVGAFNKTNTANYELMINISKNTSLRYLLEQTTHFLNVINSNS